MRSAGYAAERRDGATDKDEGHALFNNFVNRHDFADVLRRGPPFLRKVITRSLQDEQKRTRSAWSHTTRPMSSWEDIPAVRARWNRLVSGDPGVGHYEYLSKKYLGEGSQLAALSLGCGTGTRELRWAETGRFKVIDAYDLSEPRIQKARDEARKRGLHGIVQFNVADIYTVDLPEDHYDVVLGEQSLHHFSPLRDVLLRVRHTLRADGLLLVNEFVGPTRFQWSQRQLEVINAVLSALPEKYRHMSNSNSIKRRVFGPSRLRMILGDPSEAVESAHLLPLLDEIFDVREVAGYGGAILHLLFSGIAHCFLSEDAETQRLLEMCFTLEDVLTKTGDIQHDFVVAVCANGRKPTTGARLRAKDGASSHR
jgi:SAM-dependent methyltransferase